MSWHRDLAVYVAVCDSVDSAEADLGAKEELHKEELIGTFDVAVIDKKVSKPHSVEADEPVNGPDHSGASGGGRLPGKNSRRAAEQLQGSEAGLIMVGQPTLDRAFDKAVTHAVKTVWSVFDATADEFTEEMKQVVGS